MGARNGPYMEVHRVLGAALRSGNVALPAISGRRIDVGYRMLGSQLVFFMSMTA